MAKKHGVLIIGAGNIGAFFDRPGSKEILSHGHAFSSNKKFAFLGFVDTNLSKAREAARRWGGTAFNSIDQAFKQQVLPEVVVVASPDETHARTIEKLCRYSPKLIFAEKPLAHGLEEIKRVRDLCGSKRLSVLVNYSRRFVKEFQQLRENIKKAKYGNYLTGTGYYGKGILHNGSHMIDLMRFLIGEIAQAKVIGTPIIDFKKQDPSLSARLNFKQGGDFLLQAVDARVAAVFEADLFFEKARIQILGSGTIIQESRIGSHKVFKGYKVFHPAGVRRTSLHKALSGAAGNIEAHLTRRKPLLCPLEDGYEASAIALNLIKQARS